MHPIRWNYTKEEWKNFLHWKTRQKGWIFFFLQKLKTVRSHQVPEIWITADRVCVNEAHEPFQNSRRRLRQVNIRDAGKLNILELNYEQSNQVRAINVLIPKGKLRDALELQEKLFSAYHYQCDMCNE